MILAIESASTDPSVAVAAPDGTVLRLDGWSASARQAHELLPRLMAALADANAALREVTGIGVGIGPGSFTGLRVGLSIGKGLAFALGVPIVGVPSLSAWLESEPRAAGALARAGANEGYLLGRDDSEPSIMARDALPQGLSLVAPAELAAAFELPNATSPVRAAGAIASSAARRLVAEPAGDDLDHLEPRYLRPPRGVPAAAMPGG